MNCKTCNSVMRVIETIEGIWFNLIRFKCMGCGRTFSQNFKRQIKGGRK